ncbi:hypothetical protein LA303_11365 [Candidatus Sulfidibacterium hydrothermale]|uniref:hypothetical protein n=1 Tax=Candidatus Sulfidibacterium hydrothermale TaxID=2875962 RepID=UPI001F0AC0AA|nr:hypothetical protein [Candidatus Sulfidibacterium hydrothermale]UBM61995.1 hypothetical protein LA303_11365 [Candidatus Sulfidibacterium hydrothermale]
MDVPKTVKVLKNSYFTQLIPAIILLGLTFFMRYEMNLFVNARTSSLTVQVLIITLAGLMAVAFPVFYRSFFAYKVRNKKQISPDAFLSFERTLVTAALLTPYFLIVSVVLNMPQTVLILITLFALYGAYFFYPSQKRIIFDMKTFRIKPTTGQNQVL